MPSAPPSYAEDPRDHLQKRVALWAKLWIILLLGFLVLGHVSSIRTRMLLPNVGTDVLGLMHLVILAGFTGVWLLTRRGKRSERELRLFELAGLFLPLLFSMALWLSPVQLRPELVVLIAGSHALLARAVIIPSSARRTLILGVAIQIYMVAGTHAYYLRAQVPGLPAPWLYSMVVLAWSTVTVTISTLASHTIFGLRERVREITQLGQYRLEEKIGEGGMGAVYRAGHILLRRPTAVKLLLPGKSSAQDLMRFEREVQVTSCLTHPNTVVVYDYGRTPDGVFYYAMEYLEGVDLQELVDSGGAQPPGIVAQIVEQICGALEEAHSVGLIHRDIKPANVILCERGGAPAVAKVVDFGLVKSIQVSADDPGLSHVGAILGTPLYLSPEAIAGPGPVGPRSDLYSLGAVAFFLLTGTEVFRAKSVVEICGHHLHSAPERPSVRRREALPEDLEELVLSCLEKDPERRPESADSLAVKIRALSVYREWTRDQTRAWWRDVVARRRVPGAEPTEPESSRHALTVDWRARRKRV